MVAKSGIEPVNGVFAVVFKIKSASSMKQIRCTISRLVRSHPWRSNLRKNLIPARRNQTK